MNRAPRRCACGYTVAHGERCPCARRRHADAKKRQRERPSARARGYSSKWERESKAFLALPENRLCACGCGRTANVVDHKQAHKGDQRLFWSRSNWQPMARGCNSRKAAKTEGGFGNPIRGGGASEPAERGPPDLASSPRRDTPDFFTSTCEQKAGHQPWKFSHWFLHQRSKSSGTPGDQS